MPDSFLYNCLSNQAWYISVTFIKYHPQSLPFFPKRYLLSFIHSPLDESFKIIMRLVTKLCLTLETSWTVTCQAPLSMKFSRQEYWSGLPFPSPGDLPDPGIKPSLLQCRQTILRQFRHTHHALFSVELRTWGKSSWDLWSSLCRPLSSLQLYPENSSHWILSLFSASHICFLIWGLGPPPCSVACRCSSGIKLGQL